MPGDTGDDGAARDVFVWSRATGAIRRVSSGAADGANPSVSGDGRIVAYLDGAEPQTTGTATVWDGATGERTALKPDAHRPQPGADHH